MTTNHLMNTYNRSSLAFARGEGVFLWDTQGERYWDLLAGIAVNILGHAHPRLVEAISHQAGQLIHTSNLYQIPLQSQLAGELCQRTGLDLAFFCNSGAEANEAAIKLARRYGSSRGRSTIITLEGGFHGRTLGALAATAQPKYHQGFAPLPGGFKTVPPGDLKALHGAVDETVIGILLEPIQGESGVHPLGTEYLQGVRDLCDQEGILLMVDEVQTGVGRTGSFLAIQRSGVRPDICSLAKGLGGGVPIGAILATAEVAQAFEPGAHASTFGGNPLACAAALAVLEVMDAEGLLENAQKAGALFQNRLDQMAKAYPWAGQVRGAGLMLGLDVGEKGPAIAAKCLERRLLVNLIAGKTLRILPPLIIHLDQVEEVLAIFDAIFAEV